MLSGVLALVTLAAVPLAEDYPPVSPASVSPELAGASDGTLWVSWVETSPQPALLVAKRKGTSWTEPVTVAKGEKLVVNDADVPQVAALADGSVVVQWAERGEGGTTVLQVARSRDGAKFGAPVALGRAGPGERGFVRFLSGGGGFRAVWLEDGKLLTAPFADGKFGEPVEIDGRVCECCQPAVASAPGQGLVAYRDRSDAEVRDISVARTAWVSWDDPVALGPDGWKTPSCPVNGPALDLLGRTAVAAWFTAAGEQPRVQVAFSKDDGRSFGKPIQVDAGAPEGRVAVRFVDATHALVTWVERTEEGNALYAAWAKPDGSAGEPQRVAAFRGGRTTSFPKLARAGKELWLAWSDGRGEKRSPKLVRVSKIAGKADLTRKRRAAPQISAQAADLLKSGMFDTEREGVRKGQIAPEIEGRDFDGTSVTLSALRGKVVLISFWGTWCGPCREEIPEHVAMREALAAKGFEIYSVNSGDTKEQALAFAEEMGIRYPIVVDDGISNRWRIAGFPTNLILDREGKIAYRSQGWSPGAVAKQRAVVEELLAAPAPSAAPAAGSQ